MLNEGTSYVKPEETGGLNEYIEAFAQDCHVRGMTPYSVHSYMSALRSLRDHLKSMGILDVEQVGKNALKEHVRVLRQQRKLSLSTIPNHLSSISSFFDYLVYEEVIDSNLALLVRRRYLRTYKSDGPGDSPHEEVDHDRAAQGIGRHSDCP